MCKYAYTRTHKEAATQASGYTATCPQSQHIHAPGVLRKSSTPVICFDCSCIAGGMLRLLMHCLGGLQVLRRSRSGTDLTWSGGDGSWSNGRLPSRRGSRTQRPRLHGRDTHDPRCILGRVCIHIGKGRMHVHAGCSCGVHMRGG